MPTRRNYLNVIEDGRLRIENNSPVNNFNAQGIAKAFLDILGIETEKIYDNLEYVYSALDPTKAIGVDLDKIGYLVGENRSASLAPSDYSTTNFYFYIDPRLNLDIATLIKRYYTYEERAVLVQNEFITVNSNGDPTALTIPAGMTIKNFDGTITYTTINDSIISTDESYVGIISTTTGPSANVESNVLVAHSIQQIPELRKISQFIKCSNRFPIQNGRYTQTDDEFRYNIATSKSAIITNELAIRRAALSVPGVRDVLFEKNKYGNGTVNIIVTGISPLVSQGLIDAVKEKVSQQESYGDTIFIERPEYLGVELDLGIIVEPGTENENFLNQQAKAIVIQYINDLGLGEEIIWNQLISSILSITGIEDVIPKVFKYGEYDIFQKINKRQIILRYINQKSKYNQKWYSDSGLVTCCVV